MSELAPGAVTLGTDDALDGVVPLDIDAVARRLDQAWLSGTTIAPLSESEGLTSAETAYAIQARWSELRVEQGDQIIGRKIGLTSRAMQEQMGVSEPDYGSVWSSRFYPARNGRAEMPADVFIQPLAEAELAFLIGRPLSGTEVTPIEVLAATEAVAVSVEIIDSRITDWKIKLADTITDNASYGGMTVGPWQRALRHADLGTLGMVVHHNGEPTIEAVGAAALGHPARSVAWLVNKLGSYGVGLAAGDIVLSGSLGRSLRVRAGDVFQVESFGQPGLAVTLC
ncbi:fumarylacetoacetate hydrolase family protein [Micromonospora sp. FIMYZ51]|uniref:2-keto-4-pentenoate hydratase n=1 Tax=Micromonospora sp. FIMYZ51 TaxID=3051832 RepID=UPI00311D3278